MENYCDIKKINKLLKKHRYDESDDNMVPWKVLDAMCDEFDWINKNIEALVMAINNKQNKGG